VTAVCCQVEVFASSWSLVQKSPTGCDVPECDHEFSTIRRPRPFRAVDRWQKKKLIWSSE